MSTLTISIRAVPAFLAAAALLGFGAPLAAAASPPPSDTNGYLDSTARCASPSAAVLFGSTDYSRVAICKDTAGQYEYRGVRVRDGAKLVTPASTTGSGGFVATIDGITYTVTDAALTISAGDTVIRREAWQDVHGSGAAAPAAPKSTPAPKAPAAAPTPAPKPADVPINPLPAEVGGSAANG